MSSFLNQSKTKSQFKTSMESTTLNTAQDACWGLHKTKSYSPINENRSNLFLLKREGLSELDLKRQRSFMTS